MFTGIIIDVGKITNLEDDKLVIDFSNDAFNDLDLGTSVAVDGCCLTLSSYENNSMVFQVSAYLQTFQYTNIGKAAAMMVVLWAICYFLCHVFVKQWHKLKIKTKGELLQ